MIDLFANAVISTDEVHRFPKAVKIFFLSSQHMGTKYIPLQVETVQKKKNYLSFYSVIMKDCT